MWCRCGSKNGHHKETSLKEIGLRDQNLLIIVDSIVNIINLGGGGGSIRSFTKKENPPFDSEQDIYKRF